MLSTYALEGVGLVRRYHGGVCQELPDILARALWIDLVEPSAEEERAVEIALGIDVPTREEMREIESSNRLYEDHGAVYLTTTIGTNLDTELPQSTQVTFILKNGKLVTNRYADPTPFKRFTAYAERHADSCNSDAAVLAGLIESIVNRIADVIERVGADLDAISLAIFTHNTPARQRARARNYQGVLVQIGQAGNLIAKTRESLVSLGRLLAFVQQSTLVTLSTDVRGRMRTLSRDIIAMSDHASYLGNNTSFILDATLGMVNIDQNNILKIFSVVTVFLLPPSVIGAIYGMNFRYIPGAEEPWGFTAALGLMALSALVPWLLFKRRGWL